VKYAWDNDLIPETGRVLLGGTAGVLMMAAGLRLLGGRYRPVGQGLSGAGLAGLYVSIFGAHGFYNLIPRNLAMALMVLVTVCAVVLAARLDARLLAALAWIGGYLTPVLLSTGQDRAEALFLYPRCSTWGAGARPPQALARDSALLAALGTVLLYGGWSRRSIVPSASTWPRSASCCSRWCSRWAGRASRARRAWRRCWCWPRSAPRSWPAPPIARCG
jgi:uncharacterized membrane protein